MLSELIELLVNEHLDKAYLQDAEYQKLNKEEGSAVDSFSKKLAYELQKELDEVLTIKNAASANCCVLAYRQGWFDCMELLIDLIIPVSR